MPPEATLELSLSDTVFVRLRYVHFGKIVQLLSGAKTSSYVNWSFALVLPLAVLGRGYCLLVARFSDRTKLDDLRCTRSGRDGRHD